MLCIHSSTRDNDNKVSLYQYNRGHDRGQPRNGDQGALFSVRVLATGGNSCLATFLTPVAYRGIVGDCRLSGENVKVGIFFVGVFVPGGC